MNLRLIGLELSVSIGFEAVDGIGVKEQFAFLFSGQRLKAVVVDLKFESAEVMFVQRVDWLRRPWQQR